QPLDQVGEHPLVEQHKVTEHTVVLAALVLHRPAVALRERRQRFPAHTTQVQAAAEVTPRRRRGLRAGRVGEDPAHAPPHRLVDGGLPRGRPRLLTAVLEDARVAGPLEHADDAPALPAGAGAGGQPPQVEVGGDGPCGRPGEDGVGALADDGDLVRDGRDAVAFPAVGARAAGPFAALDLLVAGAPLPLDHPLDFVAGLHAELSGDQPAGGGGEVEAAGLDGAGLDGAGFAYVDVLLQLGGGAVEAVGVPGEDGAVAAVADGVEHARVVGAGFAAVGAEVVVGVDLHDGEAELGGEGFAVFALSVDAEAAAFAVFAHAAVDAGEGGVCWLVVHAP